MHCRNLFSDFGADEKVLGLSQYQNSRKICSFNTIANAICESISGRPSEA